MRILTLKLRGVGPFRDEQFIDFRGLDDFGLYLISGDTGAGKSTIIDAICFALYGGLSGDGADAARLRSDFAAPTQSTEVELLFEVSGGRKYRVIRSPRFMREKKSGTGLTESKAECSVFEVQATGEVQIARAKGTADGELKHIIGLSREQFLQTVVLPQGQFATFLRSGTKERAEVLKSIFKTDLYDRVVEVLKVRANDFGNAEKETSDKMRAAIIATRVAQDSEVEERLFEYVLTGLDDPLFAELDAALPVLSEIFATQKLHLEAAAVALQSADKLVLVAVKELEASAEVQSTTEELENDAQLLSSAQAAASELADLAAEVAISLTDADAPEWRSRSAAASKCSGGLLQIVEEEEAIALWPAKCDELTQHLRVATSSLADSETALNAIPQRMQELATALAADPSTEEVIALNDRQATVIAAEGLLLEVAQLQERDLKLTATLQRQASEVKKTAKALTLASDRWLEGTAAELASHLTSGVPCPVCGALEHPAPAASDKEPTTKDDVESRSEEATRARASFAATESSLRDLETQLVVLIERLQMTAEEVEEGKRAIEEFQAVLTARSEAAREARESQERLNTEADRLRTSLGEMQIEQTKAAASLDAATKEYTTTLAKVTAARGTFSSVRERFAAIEELASLLSTLADAVDAHQGALKKYQAAREGRAALPDRPGFGDITSADEAKLAAMATWKSCHSLHEEAKSRFDDAKGGIDQLRTLADQRKKQIEQSGDVRELARLFSPGTGTDFGLQTYILRHLFQTVVQAANLRLQSLLGGRYELAINEDEQGDGRKRLGLGLSVVDAFTGKRRPAGSLSGGETFCASLALALGLADVVQMNAGGIAIESLFIDEGFGTLDPTTLEEIMAMLSALGREGRQVGLISHVQEMKAAIMEKILVKRASGESPATIAVSWMS